MKKYARIPLAAALAAIIIWPALAQELPLGSSIYIASEMVFLLTQKSVQEELKLSDEQMKKVTAFEEKQRDARSKNKGLKGAELIKKISERIKEQKDFLSTLLKPEQLKRLKQICLQQRLRVLDSFLSNEEIAQALQLTDEQRGKVAEIWKESKERVMGAGRLDSEGLKRIHEITVESNAKAMALLTSEQKRKIGVMMGERFKGKIERPIRLGSKNKQKQDKK